MVNDAKMTVQTEKLDMAATTIDGMREKFETAYKAVFNDFRKIDLAWDGDDNIEYNLRFQSFEKDFIELSVFLQKIKIHLELTSKAYKTVESATTKTAKKLSK